MSCTAYSLQKHLSSCSNVVLIQTLNTLTQTGSLISDNLSHAMQVVYIAEPHLCRPLHLSAALVNVPEITHLLLTQGAEIDARNHAQSTPLFAACKANNPGIASKLIENGKSHSRLFVNYCIMHNSSVIAMIVGADYRAQDISGKCAFDYIRDHKEWVDSGHFTDEVKARLKGEIPNYL